MYFFHSLTGMRALGYCSGLYFKAAAATEQEAEGPTIDSDYVRGLERLQSMDTGNLRWHVFIAVWVV